MSRAATEPKLDRVQALDARPVLTPIVRREPIGDGGERISFSVAPGKLHRVLLRLPDRVEREFEFDAFGLALIALCDGRASVRQIIRRFAAQQRLDPHEAEKAVLLFLRTLMQRGVVSMAVRK